MDQKNEDRFLEQIDSELRSVNNRVKKVIHDAQALLQEYSDGEETTGCVEGPEKTEDPGHDDKRGES